MGKRKKPSRSKKTQPVKTQSAKTQSAKPRIQHPKPPSLSQEINTTVQFSHQREARLSTLGRLVFFSTQTGDAWILDPVKGLARCLSCDGEKQPITISDKLPGSDIEWNSEYRIKGSLFTVLEYSGSVRSILGYPTRQIEEAVRQMGL
jgi:hypothetical protein